MKTLEEYEAQNYIGTDECTIFEFWVSQMWFQDPDHARTFISNVIFTDEQSDFLGVYAQISKRLRNINYELWDNSEWKAFSICFDFLCDVQPDVVDSWCPEIPDIIT